MAKISVLMLVYNGESFLRESITSILNQSFYDFELIILDDGSTDKSQLIIQSFKDQRIKFFKNEQNLGVIKSRNKTLELASGEYIAILDCDDIALPNRLEVQYEFLERRVDIGICGSWYITIDQKGDVINYNKKYSDSDFLKFHMLFGSPIANSSVMMRADIVKKLKYSEKVEIAEDYDLWLRASKVTKMTNLPFYLLKYRWHDQNISNVKKIVEERNVKNLIINYLNNKDIQPSEREIDLHFSLMKRNIDFGLYKNEIENWLSKLKKTYKDLPTKEYSKFCILISITWISLGFKQKKQIYNTFKSPLFSFRNILAYLINRKYMVNI